MERSEVTRHHTPQPSLHPLSVESIDTALRGAMHLCQAQQWVGYGLWAMGYG